MPQLWVLVLLVSAACVSCLKDREEEAAIGVNEEERTPISEHEYPRENIATRPDYKGEGHWATPAPSSGIQLGFVPVKMYAQVRRSHTVKHLPRSDALASATTAEEIANAPRLREVVSSKKISEVYSEEGYEDSAYDHGGFAKEGENQEGYDHHEGSKTRPKNTKSSDEDSETQGSSQEQKLVDAESGEQVNVKTSPPLNTWKSHKVTTDEKKLMFVEDQGEDTAPVKLMASYSHTIQHPGGTVTHKDNKPDGAVILPGLGIIVAAPNAWKPVQKTTPPPEATVEDASGESDPLSIPNLQGQSLSGASDTTIGSNLEGQAFIPTQHALHLPNPQIQQFASAPGPTIGLNLQNQAFIPVQYSINVPKFQVQPLQTALDPAIQSHLQNQAFITASHPTIVSNLQGQPTIVSTLQGQTFENAGEPALVSNQESQEVKTTKYPIPIYVPKLQGQIFTSVTDSMKLPNIQSGVFTNTKSTINMPNVQTQAFAHVQQPINILNLKNQPPTSANDQINVPNIRSQTFKSVNNLISIPNVKGQPLSNTKYSTDVPNFQGQSFTTGVDQHIRQDTNSGAAQVESDSWKPMLLSDVKVKQPAPDKSANIESQPKYKLSLQDQAFPFLDLPAESSISEESSKTSYDELRKHLYGTPLNNEYQTSVHTKIRRIHTDGDENARESLRQLLTPPPPPPQHEQPSLPTKQLKDDVDISKIGSSSSSISDVKNARKFSDSVYQRKHPSIPLEEIQHVEQTHFPVEVIHDRHRKLSVQNFTSHQIQDSTEFRDNSGTELVTEALPQERKDELSKVEILMAPNKTKNSQKYTSKYKDIRKFRNFDEKQNPIISLDIENGTIANKDLFIFEKALNNAPNVNSKTKSLTKSDDQLPLWAKFIEALTLAQYSKRGKQFHDPRKESPPPKVIPRPKEKPQSTVNTHTKPYIEKYQELRNKKNQPAQSDGVEETISSHVQDGRVSDDSHVNETSVITQNLTSEDIGDVIATESMVNESHHVKPPSQTSLEVSRDKRNGKKSNDGGNRNEHVRTIRRTDEESYGTPQYLSANEEDLRLEEEEKQLDEEKERELQKNVNEWKEALHNAERGIVHKPTVNTKKYPFYKSPPSDALSPYSPLRYAINPKSIPRKTEGGMEFYESRENVYCPEVSGPQDVVPKRTKDGEWNKKPRPKLPRLKGLGDTIDCMRTKYFGSEPLDNPFFKEATVSLPQHASSEKSETTAEDPDALRFYADIMEHIRNIGDLNNLPAYSEPLPERIKTRTKQFSELHDDHSERDNRHFVPIGGQYNLETASKSNSHEDEDEFAQTSQPEVESPPSTGYFSDNYVSIPSNRFKNITHETIRYNTREPEETTVQAGLHSEHTSSEESGNTYRQPPKPEIIFGMLPPPVPSKPYIVIKTVKKTPNFYPTSILSLLTEDPVPVVPRRRPKILYNYRNIQGMMPPPIQNYNVRDNAYVSDHENELAASTVVKRPQINGHLGHGLQAESNVDVMVAEESSKPEASTSRTKVRPIGENSKSQRQKRSAVDDESHSFQVERSRNAARRTTTKKQNSRSKTNGRKKQVGRVRNSLDNVQRRADNDDEGEYLYYDYDTVVNPRRSKSRKQNQRRQEYEDVQEYSDYPATVEYDITHDLPEPVSEVKPSTPRIKPQKKVNVKPHQRIAETDSRRGEPRYYNREESSREDTRRRSQTSVSRERNKNDNQYASRESNSKSTDSKKLRKIHAKPSRSKTIKSCEESENGCDHHQKEKQKNPSYEYPDYEETPHDEIADEAEVIKSKHLIKLSSKGFENNEESSNTSEDSSKLNDNLSKFKSKYPDTIMSAEQINRILGNFMSRHNPSYSSRYNAEETTLTSETENTTASTTAITESTTKPSTPKSDDDEKTNKPVSKISSSTKNFQKARVIPILNSKVVPELVTSTIKPPDKPSARRRSANSNTQENSSRRTQSAAFLARQNRGKQLKLKQESNANDTSRKVKESHLTKTEKSDEVTEKAVNTTPRTISPRRRNNLSRSNARKQDTEVSGNSNVKENTSRSRKRIPIKIKDTEKVPPTTNNSTPSTKELRSRRKGREKSENTVPVTSVTTEVTDFNDTKTVPENTTAIPRRLQAIEHRRVTKEEIFTTTYFPEDELAREMERESELDALELEEGDESREKVARDISEEDYEDDIYEPFESYNYETKHLKYPGNRLPGGERFHDEENWNSKPGYYIFHEEDHLPRNYYTHPSRSNKESRESYSSDTSKHLHDKSEPSVENSFQNQKSNKFKLEKIEEPTSTETPTKVVTKNGVKGFYIQRPLQSTPASIEIDETREEKTGAKVLTYVVNQKTGIGEWIPSYSDDSEDVTSQTESDYVPEENAKQEEVLKEEPKLRSHSRKKSGSNTKRITESDRTNGSIDSKNISGTKNKNSSNKSKNNRNKFDRKNQRNPAEEKHDNDDSIASDSDNKPEKYGNTSNKQLSARKFHPKDESEIQQDLKGNNEEKGRRTERIRSTKGVEERDLNKDDEDIETEGDAYELDRLSGKSQHRIQKYKNTHRNKFKDTSTKVNARRNEKEEILEEDIAEDSRLDTEKGREVDDTATSLEPDEDYEDVTVQPKTRKNSKKGSTGRIVKHPGERKYYYVDEDGGGKRRRTPSDARRSA
ncbi:uncharacterized protein [Periplaneta americana]|uniref:uncharacterized protein n=1 Tax=Periplaneta americana TaxID=6978 RepID=UPI0037E7F02B